jgi:hypothetical protein
VSRSHCAGRGGEHHPRQVREHGRARRYDRRRARRVCRARRHLSAAVPLPKGPLRCVCAVRRALGIVASCCALQAARSVLSICRALSPGVFVRAIDFHGCMR